MSEKEQQDPTALLRLVWNHMHGMNMDGTRRQGDEGCADNWQKLSDKIGEFLSPQPTNEEER